MKAILVGAGGTTRELLRRLGERWEIIVIDLDESALDASRGIREFERVLGDGSSHLVLKRAGLDEADALIAATDDDEVNLEAVRIAQDAGVLRVVAISGDPEAMVRYRELGVPAISPDSLTARSIEVNLEPRRIASTSFADGKAEAIEFRLEPDSPVRGKALRELHSERYLIAAILREGELVVPHGYTTLEPGDRVTVVGAAADFSEIVRTFTAGQSRFPLTFGRKVVVGLESAADTTTVVAEALSMVRNSQAEELVVIHKQGEEMAADGGGGLSALEEIAGMAEGVEVEFRMATGSVSDAVLEFPGQESCGMIVVRAPAPNRRLSGRFALARQLRRYAEPGVPVLFSRLGHPYASILVPARRTEAGEAAGRAAIDLASSAGAVLNGIAVVPPAFVSGSEALAEARRSVAWLREEAAVQGVHVKRKIRRGNPVRVVEEMAAEASLVALGLPDGDISGWRPSITLLLVQRVASSVLLIPRST